VGRLRVLPAAVLARLRRSHAPGSAHMGGLAVWAGGAHRPRGRLPPRAGHAPGGGRSGESRRRRCGVGPRRRRRRARAGPARRRPRDGHGQPEGVRRRRRSGARSRGVAAGANHPRRGRHRAGGSRARLRRRVDRSSRPQDLAPAGGRRGARRQPPAPPLRVDGRATVAARHGGGRLAPLSAAATHRASTGQPARDGARARRARRARREDRARPALLPLPGAHCRTCRWAVRCPAAPGTSSRG
jgi:arginine/serine-rich splicing factor 4/5/6/transcription factor SPN1